MRPALTPLLIAALAATGCQQIFTFSLAAPLARPPETIGSFTAATAATYAEDLLADPDPATAAAAVGALADLVSTHPTAAVIRDAAAVAVIATGLDGALTEAITAVDVEALMAGTQPTDLEIEAIADIIAGIGQNVTADTEVIFQALADADPTALLEAGVGAETLVMAAAAITVADMAEKGVTVAELMADPTAYAPDPDLAATLASLAAGAATIDPENQLLGTLQGFLPI